MYKKIFYNSSIQLIYTNFGDQKNGPTNVNSMQICSVNFAFEMNLFCRYESLARLECVCFIEERGTHTHAHTASERRDIIHLKCTFTKSRPCQNTHPPIHPHRDRRMNLNAILYVRAAMKYVCSAYACIFARCLSNMLLERRRLCICRVYLLQCI